MGQWERQRLRRWRRPGEQVRQSLGEAPVQEAQTTSQGEQRPSSTPSACSLEEKEPAGHSLTQELSAGRRT